MLGITGWGGEAPGYWEASRIVPYVLFAYLCWTAAAFFDSGFYITERTYYKPIIMGVAAAVIFGLYWHLIPIYGGMGGAYATAGGFFVFSILTYAISQRIYPVIYPYGKVAFIIGYAGALYFLADAFLSANTWLTVGLKSIMLVAYPAALVVLGIISRADVRSMFNKVAVLLRGAKRGIEQTT
ncbi:MAG: hypothetical protein A4E72_00008 [Syntrophus sp. PtaU1.Bin208]|nr:MAG: hypothetical protein A4E72_00008 [Syntrophus sp. PtaU1.Bin208]